MPRAFPDGFLFGAAGSAHQTEGENTNSDWWTWERSPQRVSALRRLGKDPKDFVSGRACDHYHRFREDLDIAKDLGHNAHRFSIEWARIEPKEGRFDETAIGHYREVLLALRERAITPIVTLHHFTNPQWFAENGGWTSRSAVPAFTRYVERVSRDLRGLTPYWITINEPAAFVAEGYLAGAWPPQKRNPLLAYRAFRTTIRAHREAYRVLKANGAESVGIAYNCRAWKPRTSGWYDRLAARMTDGLTWQWFLDRTRGALDFVGVNYYFTNRVGFRLGNPVELGCRAEEKSDMGWDVCPEGLRDILEAVWRRYRLPIIVTENGLADADDSRREQFILDHLSAVYDAIRGGADVRGYLYWSLLDNFEWTKGFAPRFGLAHVNYETLTRTIRPSAQTYARICKTKTLPRRFKL